MRCPQGGAEDKKKRYGINAARKDDMNVRHGKGRSEMVNKKRAGGDARARQSKGKLICTS
jgi:hypothetical protein